MKAARRRQRDARTDADAALRTDVAEQLLIEEIPAIRAASMLCTSLGRGQLALVASSYLPQVRVVCQFFDTWLARQAGEYCHAAEAGGARAFANLEISCAADFPVGPFELVAIPVDPRGEA